MNGAHLPQPTSTIRGRDLKGVRKARLTRFLDARNSQRHHVPSDLNL